MRIAFQMDHPSRLNAATDTTFMLIEEAERRGYSCFYYAPEHLSLRGNELVARLQPITLSPSPHRGEVRRGAEEGAVLTFTLGEPIHASLHGMDMIWMRQDPPFDMRYITATHLLEFVMQDTPVFNNPAAVRNAPEKISPLKFLQYMPPTLISNDLAEILAFATAQGNVVAKPLYGYGGRSVFKLAAADPNIETLVEHTLEQGEPPLMWQQFRPEVAQEDKRVIMINGRVASVFGRLPAGESIRANMRVGGTPAKAELNAHQQAICDAVGAVLAAEGLLLTGLDLIGNYLTEINVTSPTGLRASQWLYGDNLAATLWDTAEAK